SSVYGTRADPTRAYRVIWPAVGYPPKLNARAFSTQARDHRQKHVDVEGLGYTHARAESVQCWSRMWHVEHGAHRNNRDVRARTEPLVLVEERPAAHARHHQVEDDDVWARHANEIQTLGTVARLADAITLAEKKVTQHAAQ